MALKTCIIIAGTTAVGKTSVAIALAQHFKTAIVSADSRQCYRELDIGVAKPTEAQLAQVKHYFINSHSITDDVNAGMFEHYALQAVTDIFREHDIAIMVGGTGLYIRAFCEGMDQMPEISGRIRDEINTNYSTGGLAWLQQEIREKDPDWYAFGEIQNPQRIMRALEVMLSSGKSIRSFQQQANKATRDFNIIKIGLSLPRAQLYGHINNRVDEMIAAGLEKEVASLLPFRNLNALQTVGYKELFACMDGTHNRALAIEHIKRNTRHYAKRQLTWFKRDEKFHWISPVDFNQLIKYLHNLV
ncbi:MAG: tRNA (adenosine(37)-N6)-dimethylallyltransferase MiaA [Chitinophagaceae bacterium]